MKDSLSVANQLEAVPPLPIVSNKTQTASEPPLIEAKPEDTKKVEEPISSFELIKTNSSVDSSPWSTPPKVESNTSKAKPQTKARRQSTEQKVGPKRSAAQSKSKSKKIKAKDDSSDEDIEEVYETPEFQTKTTTEDKNQNKSKAVLKNEKNSIEKKSESESSDEELVVNGSKRKTNQKKVEEVIEKPFVPEVIEIGSSFSGSQTTESVVKTTKNKPKLKGPKSRQSTASKRPPSVESKARPKKPKVYVSSDEELEELTVTEPKTTTKTKTIENKSKAVLKNDQNSKEKPSIADSTTDEKQTRTRKQTAKRGTNSGLNKSTKKSNIEGMAETSDNRNVFDFTDNEEKNESTDNKTQTKRKSIPKKRFAIEDMDTTPREPEVKPIIITTVKKRNQSEDVLNETKEIEPKVTKQKPRPKSKVTFVWNQSFIKTFLSVLKQKPIPSANESEEEVFKRPTSPTPSVALSDRSSTSSTNSRNRTSSTERQNQKTVVLYSGLDEKQKKKIESVCRELDGEVVSDWDDRVTHLVIALAPERPKTDMICPRNAKYIKALLSLSPIIVFWVNVLIVFNAFPFRQQMDCYLRLGYGLESFQSMDGWNQLWDNGG